MSSCRAGWVVLLVLSLAGVCAAQASEPLAQEPDSSAAQADTYLQHIKPILEQFCYACHGNGKSKGDLALDAYQSEADMRKDLKTWQTILHHVRSGEMPPRNKPQPSLDDRDRIAAWIESEVFRCDCHHPDPGRVTIRRLNRAEYNNTIHDLLGIDFHPADDFPSDDVGYGFDNIGDVLSMPPILLEKYLAAAEKVLHAVLNTNQCLEVAGPVVPRESKVPEPYQRLMVCQPGRKEDWGYCARIILERFARRAFRRPVAQEKLTRILSLFEMAAEDEAGFDQAIKVALEGILVSPHFLFRGELQPDPNDPTAVHPVDELALASRLSYFLWSTMPDDELFTQAERGTLRQNLEGEVKRMLHHPKARALVDNFLLQWLQVGALKTVAPDPIGFPEFDEDLRVAMERETQLFCGAIIEADRSVLDFLDADYTFLNERLARHYRIAAIQGPGFRRVSLRQTQRGGVLGQASFLTITSNPTRTSPVKRGKWVLDNLLGAPPPPPPPNVPELKTGKELTGTLRHRMELHRDNPLCASCHARMDPIGFGLENFDAIGRWREQDGPEPVNAGGQLVSGEAFHGPAELRRILSTTKRDEFVRCLCEKTLTYALGRGLEYYDKCAIDQIASGLRQNDYRFSSLVLAVVKSAPFQMRRGEAQ
jgi:mono/diheme cytochrome c family protein